MKFMKKPALFRETGTDVLGALLSSDPVFKRVAPHQNNRAKRLSMRVDLKNCCIRLTIPPRTSGHAICRFLENNIGWIMEKSVTLPEKKNPLHGDSILFQGRDYILHIKKHDKRLTIINAQDNGILTVTTSRSDPSSNIKRWMIDQARIYAETHASKKASIIDKKINKIDIWDTTSRWGSCSLDGRIMLSWRLVMAPSYVFDYVIAHEVAHLVHMNHGTSFWDLCYTLSDRPDDARAWLKHNEDVLLSLF